MEETLRSPLADAVSKLAGLELLLLFGSRALGHSHPLSDWDFAFLADGELDLLELHAVVSRHVASDAIDLVDLSRAGGLLRFQIARDGTVVWARSEQAFRAFQYQAASFWCDAEPIFRRAHAHILQQLGP